MAEPLMKLLDQEEEIEELQGQEGKVLTFVADEGNEPENFGFKLEEDHRLPTPGPHPNTDEDFEEFDGAEILAGREDDGGINLDDQRVHHEVGVALTGSITVNGVELTAESPLRNLRAACSFYKIGRGGGEQSAMEGSLTVRRVGVCCSLETLLREDGPSMSECQQSKQWCRSQRKKRRDDACSRICHMQAGVHLV